MPRPKRPAPLTPDEERTWRALIRLLVQLPRTIDEDLVRRNNLSLTQYLVLMSLSEAPKRSLRMSQLATAASMSPSRMTRVVQAMEHDGLVGRSSAPGDGRGSIATLTDAGLRRLKEAWPEHLASVRALILDHIAPNDLDGFYRVIHGLLKSVEGETVPRSAS